MQQEHVDWFESWFGSPYYHILYEHRDEIEAQAFVEKLIAYLQPMPGSRMLDIACGEGRFSIQLAEHGHDVTGIDLSYSSIRKAQEHESDRLHFMVHDMRLPFYINYFDYAFNFFTSFGYFAHERDHLLAARSFAGAVKKSGVLVVDYLNVDYVLSGLVASETVQRDSMEFRLERRLENQHFIKDIYFNDADGRERHYT
ncbi:MAG: class I SAM-dependent methyltransferase, partial [Sphingobacteriales bacterium]